MGSKATKLVAAVVVTAMVVKKVSPDLFKRIAVMFFVQILRIGNMPQRLKFAVNGRLRKGLSSSGYHLPPIVPEAFLVECLQEFGDHGAVKLLEKMHATYGDIFCILTPVEMHCFVSDTKSVEKVMVDKDTYPGRGIKLEIRYGLLALPTNAMWNFHRKLLSKGFSEPSLKKHNEIISQDLSALVKKLRSDAVRGIKTNLNAMEPVTVLPVLLGQSRQKREDNKKRKIATEHRFGGNTVDIHELLTRVTFDIIGKVAFGYNYNTLGDNESDAFKASDILITESAMAQGEPFFVKYFDWERMRNVAWARNHIGEVMDRAVAATKDLLHTDPAVREKLRNSKNPVVEGNILQAMLLASREEKDAATMKTTASAATSSSTTSATSSTVGTTTGLSEDEIMHEALTLQAAGHETTSNTTSWALLLLASHPEIQQWMREECQSILSRRHRDDAVSEGESEWVYDPPTFSQWRRMERTHAVLLEALRMFPTVPAFPRRAVVDTTLMGYDIPARTHVFVNQSGLNKSKVLWGDDAGEFIPSRFLNAAGPLSGFTHGIPVKKKKNASSALISDEDKTSHAWAFMPFGAGPRSCLGRRLAIMEGVMILSSLIANYEFLCPKGVALDTIPGKSDITYGPKFGLPLIVRPAPLVSKSAKL